MLFAACSDDLSPEWDEAGGSPSSFVWTRAEDIETRKAFLRNFGVGYGYNAVRGNYCNWADIRCQVVNRSELERLAYFGDVLWGSRQFENFDNKQQVNYSQRDYVQMMDLTTRESVDFGLYAEGKRTRQYVMEEGLEDNFYFTTEERIELGEQYILSQEIMEKVNSESNDNLLTQSFQDAIEHLAYADDNDYAVIDSFINAWGTHVITRSTLGGSLRVDLKNYMWRYTDYVQEYAFTTQQVLTAYNNRKESRKQDERYTWMESSSLSITGRGGDQSVLGNLIGEARYDGTRDFSIDDVAKWRQSLKFDPADEVGSNVEMISMSVTPIWDFITYPHVQRRVKAAVLRDIALQQELLGDRNFFNTSFPIRYPEATARYHQSADGWATFTRRDSEAEPMVVNIVSGGRYVATVCHEQLQDHDQWVCYPIYEGKVKLACGLGVSTDGRCYQVRWVNSDTPQLSRLEQLDAAAAAGKFYITAGIIGVEAQEGYDYAPAFAMPYVEVAGGVQPSGDIVIPACYNVLKKERQFSFWLPATASAAFVGWTDAGEQSSDGRRYTRNNEYIYIYNPTELTYE